MNEPIIRQEHLQKLEPFCRALNAALLRTGLAPEKSLEVWRTGMDAQCIRCGIQVSGQELFALSQSPSAEYGSAKLGRLRLGDCARKGCSSYYYNLTFRPHPEIAWQGIITDTEQIRSEEARRASAGKTGKGRLWLLWDLPQARRLALASFMIMLILLVRQWYIGGRIPWLREPETFFAAPETTVPFSQRE